MIPSVERAQGLRRRSKDSWRTIGVLACLTAASCAAPPPSAALAPNDQGSSSADRTHSGWETIGTSRDGRPVRAMTLGAALAPRLMLVGGIHGNEREGGRHLDELLPLLLGGQWNVRVIEDLNPDGTWRGVRGTSKGVDPNRNWPAANFRPSPLRGTEPLSEPCVAAVHADMLRFAPDIVIVLHSTSRGPFVNFDGPARPWAEVFAAAASGTGSTPWPVEPSMGYPTPGSLGSWFGVDGNRPILTIEFARGCAAKESGPALHAGLRAVLASPLDPPPEVFSVR